VLAVLAIAAAPHAGSLGAGWISDDAAALAYVHREGAWADWAGPQYGMSIVRFWRPLVTTTLGLQEGLSGLSPAPLRALNLLGHALAAVLAGGLALRLGGGRIGAAAAGLLAAGFPDVGGTVTWLVGRVDSQTVPLILGAAWAALPPERAAGDRRWRPGRAFAAAGLTFLACASKELGFATPLVGGALAWGATGSVRGAARAAAPLALAAAAALLARGLALDAWVGGYPAAAPGAGALAAAAGAVAAVLAAPLLLFAGLLLLGVLVPARHGGAPPAGAAGGGLRGPLAALAAAALGTLPLLPLLADGVLEPQNRRILFLPDALLAVAAGAALGRVALTRRHAVAVAGALAVLVLAGLRLRDARADVREWVAAAELADAHVARARAALANEPPSDRPVLDPTLPRTSGGAYCLLFGAADRFRAPFDATPRPVWPRRLLFVPDPARERRPVTAPRSDLVWAFGGAPRVVPEMRVTVGGHPVSAPLELDLDVARGGGPVLEVRGAYPGCSLEALVYTDLGYEVGTLGPLSAGEPGSEDGGDAAPVVRLSLGAILRASEVAALSAALLQAADLGATRAYLELRAVADGAGGARRPPVAASAMIPLVWSPDLPARAAAAGE
jgi:hypothetical protein